MEKNFEIETDATLFNKIKLGTELNKYEVAYLITNLSVDYSVINIFEYHQRQLVIIDIGNEEYYSLIYLCVYHNDKNSNLKDIYYSQVAKKMVKNWSVVGESDD